MVLRLSPFVCVSFSASSTGCAHPQREQAGIQQCMAVHILAIGNQKQSCFCSAGGTVPGLTQYCRACSWIYLRPSGPEIQDVLKCSPQALVQRPCSVREASARVASRLDPCRDTILAYELCDGFWTLAIPSRVKSVNRHRDVGRHPCCRL